MATAALTTAFPFSSAAIALVPRVVPVAWPHRAAGRPP